MCAPACGDRVNNLWAGWGGFDISGSEDGKECGADTSVYYAWGRLVEHTWELYFNVHTHLPELSAHQTDPNKPFPKDVLPPDDYLKC